MRIWSKLPIFSYWVCVLFSYILQFCRFDLELEKFSVDVKVLQDIGITREVIEWTEDWEKELKRENCPVVEAMFLTKYKNLSFEYDNDWVFTIYEGNCKFQSGRSGGWQLIGICADKYVEDEQFCPFVVVTMICEFQQSEGIKVHMPPPRSPEERQYGLAEDTLTEKLKVFFTFLYYLEHSDHHGILFIYNFNFMYF